jgi:MFS family permease
MTYSEIKASRFGWFLCGLAAVFYCYEYLLRIAPSVMSNELMQYYDLNATGFGNLFAVYYYIYTPMQIPVGLMLDRYGTRFLLTFATLVCAMGTFLFASSQEILIAQLGRLLVGFGSAFAFVGVLKVATIWLPPKWFGMIAGGATTLGMMGAMFGGNVMAALVNELGWQTTVFFSAFFGLFLAVIIWYYIRNERPQEQKSAPKAPSVMTFTVLLINVLSMLKKPQIWLVAIIGGILYTSLSVFAELWGIPYLQQARGFSAQEAAAMISMVFLGWAIGGPFMGFISDYLNNRRTPLWLGSLLGAVAISIFIYTDGLSVYTMGLLLFLFGICSSAENITFVIAKESNMPSLAASAIAVTNMFVMLVGTLLQPFVGKILDLYWDGTIINDVHYYSNASYQYALLIIPVTFLLAAILSFFLKKSYVQAEF